MTKNKAQQLQRLIRWYSVSAVIITGFVISVVILLPLQARLFDMQKQHLKFSRDVSALVVDACFSRIKEIANQISTRLNGRHLMTEYDTGKLSADEINAQLKTVLQNSLDAHTDLKSITRFNKQGDILISVGQKIVSLAQMKSILKDHLMIYGPFLFKKKNYLIVISPIINTQHTLVGYDLFTFGLDKFQQLIQEKLHNSIETTFVFYVSNNKLSWLNQNESNARANPLVNNAEANHELIRALETHKSSLMSENLHHANVVIAYAPIPNMPWGVVVVADKTDLYHSVEHVILTLLFIAALILFFFAFGLAAVLRPLSSRLLLENQELEDLVENSQLTLKSYNQELYQLAMLDSLTNTLTRRAFYESLEKELSRCKRYHLTCTLLFMDINRFKAINDTFGHDAGDFILKEFSNRISQLIRNVDVIARLGGDEFALLLPEKIDQKSSVVEIVHRIKEKISEPMLYQNNQLVVLVSIGTATYPDDGETVDDLLKVSDQRMYEDKHKKV